jgi:two-component system, sensor histidine kinase and response regulator
MLLKRNIRVYNFTVKQLLLILLVSIGINKNNSIAAENMYFADPEYVSTDSSGSLPIEKILQEKNTDPKQKLESLLDLTWKIRNSQPEKSLALGLQAIALADSLNDYYNLVKAHSFSGVAYRLLGDYNKAIELFFRGLELAKKHDIPQQEGYAYINIANLHIYLEFYSQALENLTPALKIAEEINDKDMLSYVFLNKGRVLMNMDSTEAAIEDITSALEIRKEVGNIPGQAVCYKYLGDIYFNRSDFEQARINYDLALSTINEGNDKDLMGNIQLQKSKIFCKMGYKPEGKPFALKALAIGKEVNSRLLIHDALKVLAKIELNIGNFESAAHLLTQMTNYADTLFSQQLSEKMLGMEFQLERQKKQTELDLIKKDTEIQALKISQQRYINIGLIVFTLMLTIAGVILLMLFKKLKQKNQQLSVQKEELKLINTAKDRMFMVIGHDLRSPVWNLRALIELIKEEQVIESNPELKENFRALSRAVQSVSDLLENLLFWAKSQDGKILFTPGPTDLKYLAIKSIQPYKTWADTKNVFIDFNTEDIACMVTADENMIQAVIRNLISNAIKYSFNDGKIEISIKKEGNMSRFSVTDFGRGISPEQITQILSNAIIPSSKGTGNEPGSGIGLSLCKDFLSKHNAKLLVNSTLETGTFFYFDLPILQRPW